jgi:hypothetical protein
MKKGSKKQPQKKRDPRPATRGKKKDASNTKYFGGQNNMPGVTWWEGV